MISPSDEFRETTWRAGSFSPSFRDLDRGAGLWLRGSILESVNWVVAFLSSVPLMPCLLLSAASAGEDLPLSVGIPTSWAELHRGVRKAVDRFHPPPDDYATIRTGVCSH